MYHQVDPPLYGVEAFPLREGESVILSNCYLMVLLNGDDDEADFIQGGEGNTATKDSHPTGPGSKSDWKPRAFSAQKD
jgi:hypothetical protein